jgi:hypothetical protein
MLMPVRVAGDHVLNKTLREDKGGGGRNKSGHDE